MTLTILLLAMLLLASTGGAQATSIGDVAWLQGCWELRDGDRVVEERWMPPHEGRMLGSGRTTRGGKEVESETITLFERDGRLAYEAHPSGQPTAIFMSRPIRGHEVVFEDPTHDFPQRVGYRETKPGALLAWIEGTTGGKTRRVEFAYRRVNCAAP
jgi:hypothetical protein